MSTSHQQLPVRLKMDHATNNNGITYEDLSDSTASMTLYDENLTNHYINNKQQHNNTINNNIAISNESNHSTKSTRSNHNNAVGSRDSTSSSPLMMIHVDDIQSIVQQGMTVVRTVPLVALDDLVSRSNHSSHRSLNYYADFNKSVSSFDSTTVHQFIYESDFSSNDDDVIVHDNLIESPPKKRSPTKSKMKKSTSMDNLMTSMTLVNDDNNDNNDNNDPRRRATEVLSRPSSSRKPSPKPSSILDHKKTPSESIPRHSTTSSNKDETSRTTIDKHSRRSSRAKLTKSCSLDDVPSSSMLSQYKDSDRSSGGRNAEFTVEKKKRNVKNNMFLSGMMNNKRSSSTEKVIVDTKEEISKKGKITLASRHNNDDEEEVPQKRMSRSTSRESITSKNHEPPLRSSRKKSTSPIPPNNNNNVIQQPSSTSTKRAPSKSHGGSNDGTIGKLKQSESSDESETSLVIDEEWCNMIEASPVPDGSTAARELVPNRISLILQMSRSETNFGNLLPSCNDEEKESDPIPSNSSRNSRRHNSFDKFGTTTHLSHELKPSSLNRRSSKDKGDLESQLYRTPKLTTTSIEVSSDLLAGDSCHSSKTLGRTKPSKLGNFKESSMRKVSSMNSSMSLSDSRSVDSSSSIHETSSNQNATFTLSHLNIPAHENRRLSKVRRGSRRNLMTESEHDRSTTSLDYQSLLEPNNLLKNAADAVRRNSKMKTSRSAESFHSTFSDFRYSEEPRKNLRSNRNSEFTMGTMSKHMENKLLEECSSPMKSDLMTSDGSLDIFEINNMISPKSSSKGSSRVFDLEFEDDINKTPSLLSRTGMSSGPMCNRVNSRLHSSMRHSVGHDKLSRSGHSSQDRNSLSRGTASIVSDIGPSIASSKKVEKSSQLSPRFFKPTDLGHIGSFLATSRSSSSMKPSSRNHYLFDRDSQSRYSEESSGRLRNAVINAFDIKSLQSKMAPHDTESTMQAEKRKAAVAGALSLMSKIGRSSTKDSASVVSAAVASDAPKSVAAQNKGSGTIDESDLGTLLLIPLRISCSLLLKSNAQRVLFKDMVKNECKRIQTAVILVFVIRSPGCGACREHARQISDLVDDHEAAVVGIVKETDEDDDVLIDFNEDYFSYPLYEDASQNFYRFLGDRKINALHYMTTKPKLKKRWTQNRIKHVPGGDYLVQGGVLIFDALGNLHETFYEQYGDLLDVDAIRRAIITISENCKTLPADDNGRPSRMSDVSVASDA